MPSATLISHTIQKWSRQKISEQFFDRPRKEFPDRTTNERGHLVRLPWDANSDRVSRIRTDEQKARSPLKMTGLLEERAKNAELPKFTTKSNVQ
jgi:YD repeat-containing protein